MGLQKIEIITQPSKFEELRLALSKIKVTGMTVFSVQGCGTQKGIDEIYRGRKLASTMNEKIKVELVVDDSLVSSIVDTAKQTLTTGKVGDGKIFFYPITNAIKIRTGEEGSDAV
ncbi:P-II family nitrogen regulator [Priestia taiwanensis]|uniref:Nitrogen regulatory PII n=1 Tax=Priestia taiwanensis TaxID=1347902 RepID=A0A917ERV6_9BACI|nr:nitrogen regulatory protein P-II 1 [Priestia taiwanensis]GGE72455.1 nitrogen regulatory PII [Priestia taiwanensis]